jgi:NAD(P)H-hydrate epimerase
MNHPTDITDDPLPRLPPRVATSHKGDFGRVLIIGGSRNMSGAVALAGMAALRAGAGLVTLAVPRAVQSTVAAHEPSVMTLGLPDDESGQIAAGADAVLGEPLERATAVAVGPGLGRGPAITELVGWLYTTMPRPLIVDADGLNALSNHPTMLASPAGSRILTPHPGEFARLTGHPAPPATDEAARAVAAAGLAAADPTGQTIVVLKGHHSVVADSGRCAFNRTGNPGMASGGSGDVLTGVAVALAGQDCPPFDAARLAVHVHGDAGDLAAAELGETSLIASDLVRFLPAAFRRLV